MAEVITKLNHPLIQEARELARSKNRTMAKKIQLRGLEQLNWAKNKGLEIENIFISEKENPKLYPFKASIYLTSDGIMKKVTETNYLIPCVGVAKVPDETEIEDFVILLDNVKDHGNIGTIIRTGRAYGINDFIATNEEFDPFFPKTIDASRGTVFETNFKKFNKPLDSVLYLKKKGYQIVATSPHAPSIQSELSLEKRPIALVVGNETSGVSEEIMREADYVVQMPMYTNVESLNVGVATGISIHELRLKEALTMLAEKIINSLGREVNVTSQLIRRAFNIKLHNNTDFTGDQIIFLMVLKRESQMNEDQVQKQFGYDDTEIQGFLQPLYAKELISKGQGEINITVEGERVLAKLWPIHENVQNSILKGFTKEEVKELKTFLNRIQNNCLQIIEYKE